MRTSTVALGLTIALLGAGLAGVPGALADTAICGDAGAPPSACEHQVQTPEAGDACERDEDGDGIPDRLDDDNNEIPDTPDDGLEQLDQDHDIRSWAVAQASDLCQAAADCAAAHGGDDSIYGLGGDDRAIDTNPASTPDQEDSDGDGVGDACEQICAADADTLDGMDSSEFLAANGGNGGDGGVGEAGGAGGDAGHGHRTDVAPNPNQDDTDGDGIGDACDPADHVRDCGAALAEGAACDAPAPVSVGGEQYADAW